MENFREFAKDLKYKNWLKGVMVLKNLHKLLEPFIDKEIEIFHGELGNQCGRDHCVKECDLGNWNPRSNQIPPLDCEVCSRWSEVIWTNSNRHGKVCWLNSKPHLWSRKKWEVAKVYMPGGHKDHNSVGDFDIAARLRLMSQCKYFKKFELGGLCDKVSNVRNKIMHAPRYQLEQKDLQDYFNRIRELGEKLARHDPKFKNLSEVIDEIQNLDFRLILPEDIAAQTNRAKTEKELEDMYFALAQEAAEHLVTRVELEKQKQDKLALAQEEAEHLVTRMELKKQKQDKLAVAQEEAEHLVTRMKLEKLQIQVAQQEQDDWAVAQREAEHHVTRMKLEKLERQIAQQDQDHLALAQEEAEHHVTWMELEKLQIQIAQQEQDDWALAQEEAEHLVTRMELEKLQIQMAQQEQDDWAIRSIGEELEQRVSEHHKERKTLHLFSIINQKRMNKSFTELRRRIGNMQKRYTLLNISFQQFLLVTIALVLIFVIVHWP